MGERTVFIETRISA